MLRLSRRALLLASVAATASACMGSGEVTGLIGPNGRLADFASLPTSGHIVAAGNGTTIPDHLLEQRMQLKGVGKTRGNQVPYTGKEEAGTIVIEQARQSLYLVEGNGKATRYSVAVGSAQNQWTGEARVSAVHLQPGWSPPDVVRRANPNVPDMIPGGAPNNPMGIGALTLTGGDYAIHGTNRPDSIGRAVSFGCFRMYNEDIADLMRRVRVGTRVVVNG